MPSIVIPGLAASDPLPGVYASVDFAAGPVAGGNTAYPALIIGNKLAAGSATADTVLYGPDTPTTLVSLTDAANLFGIGSEAYRMFKRWISVNPVTPVYVICPAESTGVQATGTLAMQAGTGTTSTGSQALPAVTFNVASTTGFPSSGTIIVASGAGQQVITYTGVTATSFTGCTGGTGTVAASTAVYPSLGAATANGFVRVFVADDIVDVTITNGDTATTIASNVASAINGKAEWPMTAAAANGVVTLTSRQKGIRGNWLRFGATVFNSPGVTPSQGPMANLSGGTVADSWANALATIAAKRFYYIVSAADGNGTPGSAFTADANLLGTGGLVAQVASQAVATTGIRQKVIAGAIDGTPSNVTSAAVAGNNARAKWYYQYLGDVPPCELAAVVAGAEAAFEAAFSSGTLNFDNFGQTPQTQALWKVPTPRVPTAVLSRAQLVSCLNNGVSPIANTLRGTGTYLVSRITSRSQTAGQADYRVRDDHKPSVCDRYTDDLQSKVGLQASGKVVQSDPQPGQRIPGPNVFYPRLLTALINKQTREYAESDLLQNPDQITAGTYSNRETAPTTRLTAAVPLQPVDVLHQVGLLIEQVS